jgi:hypothetical protein
MSGALPDVQVSAHYGHVRAAQGRILTKSSSALEMRTVHMATNRQAIVRCADLVKCSNATLVRLRRSLVI